MTEYIRDSRVIYSEGFNPTDLAGAIQNAAYELPFEGTIKVLNGKVIISGKRWATAEEIADSKRDLLDDAEYEYEDDSDFKYEEWFQDIKDKAQEWSSTRQSNMSTADVKSGLSSLLSRWEDVVDAGQNLLAECSKQLTKLSDSTKPGEKDTEK